MIETEKSLGPIMKAARKFKKLNQADVASAIGCSQSALSKMEHNHLIPSAPQWFLFSRFTTIPPESLELGIINREQVVKFNNEDVSLGFKIPKRYKNQRSMKVREVFPLYLYIQKKFPPDVLKKFEETLGLDPEFFIDFDNLINFNLLVDSVSFVMTELGKKSKEEIKEIVQLGQTSEYWGKFSGEWRSLGSVREVLEAYISSQSYFQTDFNLEMGRGAEGPTLSFSPRPHLKVLKEIPGEFIQFLKEYRRASLEVLLVRELGLGTIVKLNDSSAEDLSTTLTVLTN